MLEYWLATADVQQLSAHFMLTLVSEALHSPLAAKLGMALKRAEHGEAQCSLAFSQSNTTVGNVVHGGAILSLADSAATAAIWSLVTDPQNYRGLTIDLSMSFVSAARGADLLANAKVLKRGRSVCYCDVEVVTKSGDLVAKAKVAYKLSRNRTPSEVMSGLFEGKTQIEQMTLLAELELTGAEVYRTMADKLSQGEDQDSLRESATREEANAAVLNNLIDSNAS